MRRFVTLLLLSCFIFSNSGAAFAKGADDEVSVLKEQLEILKKQCEQYEEHNAKLEDRVKKLEDKVESQQATTAQVVKEACPMVAKEVMADVKCQAADEVAKIAEKTQTDFLRKYSGQVAKDSRSILDKIPDYIPNYITRGLEFHGYFRSGYGINSKGGKMEAFQAPDALAKYRLGNEQETYIETVFLNKNWNPDPNGVTLETQIRMSYKTQQNQSWDPTNEVVLREMYGRMGNFVKADPGIKVWAGERFYRLPELDINDFWWSDMSGYGGGFEDINLGIGKLAVAYIGYSDNDIMLATSRGRLAKNNLHFMLYDVNVPYGKGTFWVNGGYMKGGTWTEDTNIKYPDMGGVDVGFMHYVPGEKANNQLGVQFGCGSNTSLSAGANIPSSGDDRNSWRVRLTDMYNNQITDKLSMQAVGVYQYTDYGDATKNTETWISTGIRPIYMLTNHFGIEVEPGMDYINNPGDNLDAFLFKLTGGLRITPGMIFNSRPAFRLFATYARWNDGFKGNASLGGDAFTNLHEGMNYGIQCENWW